MIGNLTVDDVVRADGQTMMGSPGGNAVYAAVAARLWAPAVGLVTRRGPDLPPEVLPTLAGLGVELDGVVSTGSPTSRAWLLYEHDGARTFVDRSTPEEAVRWVEPSDIPAAWLAATPPPVVLVAPMPLRVAHPLVRAVRQTAPEATIVVDPHESWACDDAELAELASGVDVFAPSRDELLALVPRCSVVQAAERLRALGFGSVVAKLGADGALVVDSAGVQTVPAQTADPVDVTGAGDTFCGALAGALAAGLTLHQAGVRASHTAAWSIEQYGSLALASLTPTEAENRMNSTTAPPARTVAVLGSARLGPDDPRWHEAHALGRELGSAGWTVMTGGYGGLMAATAQGAAGAGAAVVGLPMTSWVGLEPSSHHSELRWSSSYAERLSHILGADVVVALPGGIGTLAEATVVWSALQTEPGAARLVLLGAAWRRLLGSFGDELVVGTEDLNLARVADDVAAAVAAVEQAYADTTAAAGPRG